jgi:hypothetical protein
MGNLPHGSKSARDASAVFVEYANAMALVLLTSQSFFYAGNAINLALPTILLPIDGLRRGGGGDFDLVLQHSIFSSSLVLWETAFLG